MGMRFSKFFLTIIFLLPISRPAYSQGQDFDEVSYNHFMRRIKVPISVNSEINKFKNKSESLPEGYAESFVKLITSRVQEEKRAALNNLNQKCQNFLTVSFSDSLPTLFSENSAVKEFESGLIRIESSTCFTKGTPEEIINIFSDPNFQNEGLNTLKESHRNADLICDWTEVPTIGTSKYCYFPMIEADSSLALHHHFNISNDPDPKIVKVYFRELFATAQRTDSGVAFHMITFLRSSKISGIKKVFARTVIAQEQEKSMTLLQQKLK